MSIPIKCPNCSAQLKAKETHIGKKLACPKCKTPFLVTAPQPQAADDFPDLSSADTAAGPFDGGPFDGGSDLANLDLGDLGQLPSGSAFPSGASLPNMPLSSPDTQPVKQPASRSQSPSKKFNLCNRTIALIAGGSVGAIVLLSLITGVAMWALKGSSDQQASSAGLGNDSAPPGTAASPATSTASPATVAASTAPPAVPEPPKFVWQSFVTSQATAGKDSFASLSSSEAGVPTILLATSDRKKFAPESPRSDAFPDATGIPLAKRPPGWLTGQPILKVMMYETARRQREQMVPAMKWQTETPEKPQLLQNSVDGDGYTLARLLPVGSPSAQRLREIESQGTPLLRSDHHHLWSTDGKALYVLAGVERVTTDRKWSNRLLKIDPQTWSIEKMATVQLPSFGGNQVHWRPTGRISDFAWSSEGLVAVIEGAVERSLASDESQTIWFPLTTEQMATSSLVVLDPATLELKHGWTIPSLPELSGTPSGPLVYLQNRGDFLCVVNVQSGEVVNLFQRQDSMKKPQVTPDGSWLLGCGMTSVNRFRLAGNDVVFDQNREGIGKRGVILSPDGQLVSFHGRDKYYAVRTADLNEIVGSASGGEIGQMALDSVNKTVFVCSVELPQGNLVLQVNREENPLQVELDSLLEKSGENPSSAGAVPGRPAQGNLHEQIWPLGMSVEPTRRGVLVFVETGAYWFEPRS